MKYYSDYDTEPSGNGNPNYRCVGCKKTVPEINGELENHSLWCPYREKVKAREEIDFLKFLIENILDSLPSNKDWLNPEIEKAMKDSIK